MVEEELKNRLGQIDKGLVRQAEECKLCSIGDEEPSKFFMQEVAPISTPPHYLPSRALTCFSHSTYYNSEICIHLSV